jgi:hypothetical protein
MRVIMRLRRLSTGAWHVRGDGVCNWAQGQWPHAMTPFVEAGPIFCARLARWQEHWSTRLVAPGAPDAMVTWPVREVYPTPPCHASERETQQGD